jgi:hypothetical protein
MKIGDRVKILATGKVGVIIGETDKGWKIDLGGDRPVLVLKSEPMIVLVNPKTDPTPNPRPKKRWGWKRWLWTIGLILAIGGAVALTIINVI